MATAKTKSAARKNVRKAANAAKRKRTLSKQPRSVRSAMGKRGAASRRRRRSSR